MTLSSTLQRAKELCGLPFDEELPDLADARLADWANELQREVAKFTRYKLCTFVATIPAGEGEFDTSPEMSELLQCWVDGRPIPFLRPLVTQTDESPWDGAGAALALLWWGGRRMRLYPRTHTADQEVRIDGVEMPPLMVLSAPAEGQSESSYFLEHDAPVLSTGLAWRLAEWMLARGEPVNPDRLRQMHVERVYQISPQMREGLFGGSDFPRVCGGTKELCW